MKGSPIEKMSLNPLEYQMLCPPLPNKTYNGSL